MADLASRQIFYNANLYTPVGNKAKKGEDMNSLTHIPNCQIEVQGGIISYVGPRRQIASGSEHDLGGKALLPGFVDSHTHLPFVGIRADEFMWRLRGDSYMSILERGGGIISTMKAVRAASTYDLLVEMDKYIDSINALGVTTLDAKSGYGLDKETELKQLEAIKQHNGNSSHLKVTAEPTYLGGHAIPPEYAGRPDDYISFMIDEMLPEIKEKGLAKNCDIFCEKGVFTIDQSRRFLKAAKDMGFGLKIHADEIVWTGGAELAAELGALSADHLLHISDEGIMALAKSGTIATLLPVTAFALREEYAPARKMIDAGCAVALATDFNPGSCYSYSVPLMIALATIHMQMSLEETITALTLNGAAALGLENEIGSIEVGKRADFITLKTDNINMLPYSTGANCVDRVYKGGVNTCQN